jgi:hypothetical protein
MISVPPVLLMEVFAPPAKKATIFISTDSVVLAIWIHNAVHAAPTTTSVSNATATSFP